jgi:hypothetical protein
MLTTLPESLYTRVASLYRELQVANEHSKSATRTIILDPILTPEQYYQISCFNLEAAICLKNWTDAEGFIRDLAVMRDGKDGCNDDIHAILVDLILTSDKMPSDYIIRSLQVFQHQFSL